MSGGPSFGQKVANIQHVSYILTCRFLANVHDAVQIPSLYCTCTCPSHFSQMPVLIAATAASKEPADGFLVKDIVSILNHFSHMTLIIPLLCVYLTVLVIIL